MTAEQRMVDTLRRARLTLAVAESCTGGMVGAAITSVPGSSDVFLGGLIAYADEIKERVLGVAAQTLAAHGAVSREAVTAMLDGVCKLTGATCAIAVSGVAGPSGGTAAKPVGLVFVGVRTPARACVFEHRFNGDRGQVREQSVAAALGHMLDELEIRARS